MNHKMRLCHEPFAAIKKGYKTIEMRLLDDKRRLINLGDEIEFTDITNNDTLTCEVLSLNEYENFEELYKDYDKSSLGYEKDEEKDPNDMLKYYTLEDIKDYGVVAIKIKEVGTF